MNRIKWWYLITRKAGKCRCCLFCRHFKQCVEDNRYLFEEKKVSSMSLYKKIIQKLFFNAFPEYREKELFIKQVEKKVKRSEILHRD